MPPKRRNGETTFHPIAQPAPQNAPTLKDGYCYEYDSEQYGDDWKKSPYDAWETVMRSLGGKGKLIGNRIVDGVRVNVFSHEGKIYAQTALGG